MTPIYAIRKTTFRTELIEFDTVHEMAETAACMRPEVTYERVSGATAHQWVRDGRPHMTGLWLDGNRIRYAPADPHG